MPDQFPAELSEWLRQELAEKKHEVCAIVREILKSVRGSTLMTLNVFESLKNALGVYVPAIMAGIRAYIEQYLPIPINPGLNPDEEMLFSLLFLKDPATVFHCLDTPVVALILGKYFNLPAQDLQLLEKAANLHDVGKIELLDIVLANPFPKDWLPLIFGCNLLDRKRSQKTVAPEVKNQNFQHEAGQYNDLLDPIEESETDSAARKKRVREYLELLCQANVDFRPSIPVRYLAQKAKEVHENDGCLTAEMRSLFEPKTDDGKMIDETTNSSRLRPKKEVLGKEERDILDKHADDFQMLELLFALAGIDGWKTSFKEALHLHTDEGIPLIRKADPTIAQDILTMIANHHENGNGQFENLDERMKQLVIILRLADIIAALSQKRQYKEAYDAGEISRILDLEARDGVVPMSIVNEVRHLIVQGNAGQGEVIKAMYENSSGLRDSWVKRCGSLLWTPA